MSGDDTTRKLPDDLMEQLREQFSPIYALQKQVADLTGIVQALDKKVDALDSKVDTRLKETRPIWEAVQAQIKQLSGDVEKGFHRVERRIDVASAEINKLQTEIRLLDERLEKLEKEPA